jgi:hypothetical protein
LGGSRSEDRGESLKDSNASARRFHISLDIQEEALTPTALSEHAAIPIAFVVDRLLEIRLLDGGLGGMSLTEAAVTDPYVKDYYAIEGAGAAVLAGTL